MLLENRALLAKSTSGNQGLSISLSSADSEERVYPSHLRPLRSTVELEDLTSARDYRLHSSRGPLSA